MMNTAKFACTRDEKREDLTRVGPAGVLHRKRKNGKLARDRHCSGNIGFITIWVFIYIQTLCMRALQAMSQMRICAGSPEPSLLGYMICAKIS